MQSNPEVKKVYTENRLKTKLRNFIRQWQLQLMVVPAIALLFIFCYIPMGGIVLAFKDFSMRDGIFGSPWAGWKNFADFFNYDEFGQMIINTLGINLLKLAFSFPIPIIFAILLNELVGTRFKKLTQTVAYLPHFISWVVVVNIFMNLLSTGSTAIPGSAGVVNKVLMALHIVDKPVNFAGDGKYFWGLMVVSGIWKEAGWNSIIFIAALSTVNVELYDAADVDGAGRFNKIFHITLPALSGAITICLLFNLSGMMTAGFDQIFLFQNDLNLKNSEVLDTYIYKTGIVKRLYSYSAAGGLFQSIINFAMLITSNTVARKINGVGLF